MKLCILTDKPCNACGECDRCDLDPEKICDSCGKCIDTDAEYRGIAVDDILLNLDRPAPPKKKGTGH